MRNMGLWQLGPIVTSSYFKRGHEAVSSRSTYTGGCGGDGMKRMVEDLEVLS